MTTITRLDDLHCQTLSGGSGMLPTYPPKGCYRKSPTYHVPSKYMSVALTSNSQGNFTSNTAIGLGGLAGLANASSFQSNIANIITTAG